jgi:MEMO1 family protein
VLRGRRALVVASSDLSHYPAAKDAAAVDGRVLDALLTMDAKRFRAVIAAEMARGVPGLVTCACGEAPILAALAAARALGASRATLVRHATSADVPEGPPGQAVGYGAVSFDAGEIDPEARAALLARAREAIPAFLATGKPPPPRALPGAASLTRGAFVTLTKGGELRGCIGRMSAVEPLASTVTSMAIAAAVEDPRFPPVTRAELSGLRVEISVLTPNHPVPGPEAVVVGRDGVLLSKGGRSAVFLPQVATEQGWGREQLLDHLCEKAGMPATCWREGASLAVFQAEVFGEEHAK